MKTILTCRLALVTTWLLMVVTMLPHVTAQTSLTNVPSAARGSQRYPAVASDGRDYFVTWVDDRSGYGVYGTRVTRDGKVLDANGIPISVGPYTWEVAVAFGGTNYLVVWRDSRTVGTNEQGAFDYSQVYGARITRDGRVLDPNGFRISYGTQCTSPAVAFNGTNFLVVWRQWSNTEGTDVAGIRVSPAGVVLDPDDIAITKASGWEQEPDVASVNGQFLVAWVDPSYPPGVKAMRLDGDGTELDAAPLQLMRMQSPGRVWLGASDSQYLLAAGSNAWQGTNFYSTLYGARVNTSGLVANTNIFSINRVTNTSHIADIGSDGTHFFILWSTTPPEANLYGCEVTAAGVVSSRFLVSDAPRNQINPALAWNGLTYLAAWTDDRSGSESYHDWQMFDIYGSFITTNRIVTNTNGLLISTSIQQTPAVLWPDPAPIVYGTPLWSEQLNATADVPGTFTYTPSFGTILDAGSHVLLLNFTPADPEHYESVSTYVGITVHPAPLTIRVDNKLKFQGQPNPTLTASYSGLVAQDTPATLDVPVELATTATTDSPPGNYPIIMNGAFDFNYTITGIDGALIVRPAPAGAGTLDASFDPIAQGDQIGFSSGSGWVTCTAVQPDGKVLVGGNFIGVDGLARNNLVRLHPDGTVDTSFDTHLGADYEVNTLTLQPHGSVIVGGQFVNMQGRPRTYLARLFSDGALDEGFAPQFTGPQYAYVASTVLQPDGKILVGGRFEGVNGVATTNMVRLDASGNLDPSFALAPELRSESSMISLIKLRLDGRILINHTERGLLQLNPNGALDTSFTFNCWLDNGGARPGVVLGAEVLPDGKCIVAGTFDRIGTVQCRDLARLNPNGTVDLAFDTGARSILHSITAMAVQADGCVLTAAQVVDYFGDDDPSVRRPGVVRYYPHGLPDIDYVSNDVASFAYLHLIQPLPNGEALFADRFGGVRALTRHNFDGIMVQSFDPQFSRAAYFYDLALQPDGKILVSGNYSTLNGQEVQPFGRLLPNGQPDPGFHLDDRFHISDAAADIQLQPDGKILIAGEFDAAGEVENSPVAVARLNVDGSLDDSFHLASELSQEAALGRRLVLQPDGKIVIAAVFVDDDDDIARATVMRLNSDGSADTGFRSLGLMRGAELNAIALQADGKVLVAGRYYVGQFSALIHRHLVRLLPNGNLDPSFHITLKGAQGGEDARQVRAVTVQPDGRILVAGNFFEINGVARPGLARLNSDGSVDLSFDPPASDFFESAVLALQPDGKVLLASFYTRPLVRLNSDGSLDVSFASVVQHPNGYVAALALQPNGQLLIAGWFRYVSDIPVNGLARLNNDLSVPFVQRQISRPTVQLIATPSTLTTVFAVEDQVLPGGIVTGISHDGVYDPTTMKVKFGPFYDHQSRALSYTVVIPTDCVHGTCSSYAFTGSASADGLNTPILGDQQMFIPGLHPADMSPIDSRLSMTEITAYGAAWRRGDTWSVAPVPIPMDYATRAAALWRGGECYQVDFAATNSPLWWVNCEALQSPAPASLSLHAASVNSFVQSELPSAFVPGEPLSVRFNVSPATGVLAYAVESAIPSGWIVSNISDGGYFDTVNRKVKWGPFVDSRPRALAFLVTPPSDATGVAALATVGSFDGINTTTDGATRLREMCRLAYGGISAQDEIRLTIAGRLGARLVIEASPDLRNWTPLQTVVNTDGAVVISDPNRLQHSHRFYRVKAVE